MSISVRLVSVFALVSLLSSAAFSQEVIIVGHKDKAYTSRIDGVTNAYVSTGAGVAGVREIIQWPSVASPEKLFTVSLSGKLQSASSSLTSFSPLTSLGNVQGIGLASVAGITSHIPAVGQLTSNATSASFLELKSIDNDGSLDVFASSELSSNWTDVAFVSNGTSFWKYGIADMRGTGTYSKFHVMDVSAYRGTGGGNGGVDPGFDPNTSTNGPPYSQLPTQFSSQPAGVLSTYDLVGEQDMRVDVFNSPSGNRYFVVSTSIFDCSPAQGIQYGLGLYVHNASAATGAPAVAAGQCFGLVADAPSFKFMRVFGNFAVVTESLALADGTNLGAMWMINLRQWESAGWLGFPATRYSFSSPSHGVDGIGTNLTQSKLYIGSDETPPGKVIMYPVNFALTTGTAVTSAPANIVLLTTQEQDSINPPTRPYPFCFTAVDEGAGSVFAPFGAGAGGNGGGCSASSSVPLGLLPLLPVAGLLLFAALRRR